MKTGTGTLLRSGNIKDYTPLGVAGNPVYKWATQIRVAIKRKINVESAQVFSVPQPNENGDIIDWYAPVAGFVIPWSSATPEEKKSAKEQLEDIKQQLDITVDEFRNSEHAEQSVFYQMLAHVLQFPDDEHVYLVNGKPVLTFWGFVNSEATSRPNPLAILIIPELKAITDTVHSDTGVVEETTINERPTVSRRSFWWWLLPLLLLLLLLLFMFRGSDKPDPENPPDKSLPVHTQTDDKSEFNTTANDIDYDTTLQGSRINIEKEITEYESPSSQSQNMLPEQRILEESEDSKLSQEPEEMGLSNIEPIEQSQESQNSMLPEGHQTLNESSKMQPLMIPDESNTQNSTDFLNGHWQANSGLMDDQGRPINLEYEFKDGKGSVRIKRNDAVCSGSVKAKRNGSELTFSDQEIIKCQDGRSYQPAKVKCNVNADKQTVCEGTYSGGERFNMNINKVKKID